ncbi:centrosomal protein of 162 kDa isoform X1 [Crotalus tigris]|uniref:centrosomal protein of 162 kDa isoform X1 n=1 Tax=Crotalus tigris TaxID=88082 RepID=UPI00192F267A|nr:centrosomal protein of 162 kDa isoform X1 [Crotalus tigris]XP_039190431.1 centrosomal protein of 162 kDa isoform X1 [Crotalus tigris]XP_039190432.1 centrosomal protein of 162 kDa isoform X1 [Crotalus tigris]XP_039190434.1 centrosomal protein of 162 kDa isoform X1 [Crotalus tigris]XP_039190435.1 centrosomal protein of 162 kDa isoform X1 [Crotalus tigris]XP_039190436.1 centrosomal protein of 162 kDa isoform X1 [Crotalus tigris]
MAHRFSMKDIDEKFEQFLKESLSDDSLGNEQNQNVTIPESVEQSKNKKHPVPWWITEDDSDDVPKKSKFIKSVSKGNEKKLIGRKDAVAENYEKRISFSDNEPGIPDTSNNFLKSRKLSPSIEEVDEDFGEDLQLPQLHGVSVSLSKDSLESNDSVVALGPSENILGDGLDTLEEEEEKEKFFADLEKGASSTIDYSKLNQELDSNNSEILHTFLRNQSQAKQTKGEDDSECMSHEKSGDYSEDFEENSECNEDNKAEQVVTSEATEERTGMLAKVLLDSQESVLETPKTNEQQDAAVVEQHTAQEITVEEMTGTGISSGQTNSDIEALHQAYRHVEQSLGATDEQNVHDEKIEVEVCLVNDTSQNKESCPQNTSITNSDLPTIEELMKPIRADSSFVRGFELEPVSPVKVTQDHPDGLMKTPKEHPNDTSVESQNIGCLLNHHGEQEDTSVLEVANESSKDSPHLKVIKKKLADKIKHDAMKLSTLSDCSTLYQERKSGQMHQPNTWNKENPNLVPNKQVMYKNSKNTMIIHRKKHLGGSHSSIRSSGYGKPNSSLKHLPTVNEKTLKESNKNPLLKVKSPPRQKGTSVTKVIQTKPPSLSSKRNDSINPGQPSSGEFPPDPKENDIQHHKISDTTTALQQAAPISSFHNERELYLLKRVQEAEEELTAANTLIERLKATSLQTEKEMEAKILERKVQQDKELSQLSQENYVLQTQLNNIKDLKKGTMWSTIREKNLNDEEMLKEIQKEIQNQEILLQGYHQENERLYKQVKELQLNNKKNEEIMFKENQRLMTQLAALQEKLEKNNVLSHGVQNDKPSENQNFTDLISELRTAKATEANLLEERKHLKQDKQSLEVDLAQMKKERDLARAQIVSASGEKSYEMKIMEESYKGEINRLQKRLQWYAENQELLDKDAARLRGAKEEISKLKVEVEKLRSEAGHHSAQQRTRLKNRAADAKRIQDLERQVKEMEGILKRRYPNSLPALIYAAATAASEGDGDATPKSNTVEFLEKRVKKLETELEGKDDEAKKSLRAMEQQFQKIKLQYEKRIEELEQLLAYKLLNEPQKLQDKSSSFDQELCKVNEAHQETVQNLQAEINSLRSHVAQLESQRNPRDDVADLQSLEHQVEQARAKAQLVRLNQEMIAKNREIKDLTKTVERLQKERRRMLSSANSGRRLDKKGMLEKDPVSPEKKVPRNAGFFPDHLKDKIYQPDVFADAHISEVQQENAHLKEELEKLKLELNEERVTSQAALANAEDLMRRAKEELQGHIATLKVSHQKELERILCQQAREYSISKAAELNSKISSQENLIKYLQQQVHELQKEEGALAVSQRREAILQKEMGKLLEELKVARENQSPELKRFSCLERKIRQLETSYEQREQELQQVIQQTRYNAEVKHLQETEKWRKLALLKNQELEKFRVELDSMLDVLRQLQKQGVVITPGSSNMPENYWKI